MARAPYHSGPQDPKILPDTLRRGETLIITIEVDTDHTTIGHFRVIRSFSPRKKLEEFLTFFPQNKETYKFNEEEFAIWLEYEQPLRLIRRIPYTMFRIFNDQTIAPNEASFYRIPTPKLSPGLKEKEKNYE